MSDITWKTMLKMREKTKEVCEEYSLPLIEVTYNNRLKTTAGRYCWNTYKGTQYIEIATNLVEKFGVDRGMTTLLHELAHYINQVKYNGSGHCPRFKSICAKIGGTMNTRQSGTKYAECATKEFITTPNKYKYTCTCGQIYKSKKKINDFNKCRICGTFVIYMTFSLNV